VIVISIVIAVFVVTFVVIAVPHFMAVPVRLVAIAVSISIPSYLPAAVDPPVIRVVVVSAAVVSPKVVSVMIVPDSVVAETGIVILVEARVISKARFVLASPFPIFPLPFAAEPVVFDIVVPAFRQPLPVVRIVPIIAIPVISAAAVIRIV
jgi:hypothetical protein